MESVSILKTLANMYLETNDTYEKDIELYINYIDKIIKKGNEPMDISKEDITNSVIHYNNLKKIGTSNTLERYLSGIKSFYKYLVDKKRLKDVFFENFITSHKEYIDEICKNEAINFNAISNRVPFPQEIIIEILEKLDTFDYKSLLSLSETQRQWYYKYKMLGVYIKLTLIAPAKKSVITKLTLQDLDLEKRLVSVNNILIDIPNGLYRDLNDYLYIRLAFDS